jgi:M6 family metalloprotease-like protein
MPLLMAAWLDNVPQELVQPDGTVINAFASGDEFHNWAHDENYYTIIQDETGYWCWAKNVDGDVVSTGYAIHQVPAEQANVKPRVNISREKYTSKRESFHRNRKDDINNMPTTGTVYNIVVFIRFADQGQFSNNFNYYNGMFNPTGENVNSMKQYFLDSSFDQLTVESPFFPTPDGNIILSYQSDEPRRNFMPYHPVNNPDGYINQDTKEHDLLAKAIAYIEPMVPLECVANDPEFVNNVCFIVRGGTTAWATLLWPHMWYLNSQDVRIHGKRVTNYNFNIDGHMSPSQPSVLYHEFSHSLGSPDYYRYDDSRIDPVNRWSIMSNDTNPPNALDAHTKSHYFDWVTLQTATTSGYYTLHPNTVSLTNSAIIIPSKNSTTEYFIAEYRNTNTGLIDKIIPGSGLIIWRVDTLAGGGNAYGDNELYVFRPGGTPDRNGSVGAAHLTTDVGRSEITDITDPYTFLQDGTLGGLTIYEIGPAGETITFYLDLDGPNPDDFDESFEDGTFNNFDWVNDQTNPWTITSEQASNGTKSATIGSIPNGAKSKLTIDMNLKAGFLQFFVKTNCTNNVDYLKLFINGIAVKTWTGNNEWEHYYAHLNEGIYNIYWEYSNGQASDGLGRAWIDQIGFPDTNGFIAYPPANLNISAEGRDLDFTWQPPFTTTLPNPPDLLGYNFYMNDRLLNEEPLKTEAYQIINSSGGELQFSVSAVYEDIGESYRSNWIYYDELEFTKPINLYVEAVPTGVFVSWEYEGFEVPLNGFRVFRNGVNATGNTFSKDVRSFIDTRVTTTGTYTYYAVAVYRNPSGTSEPTESIDVDYTDNTDVNQINLQTALINNYPNPFNPSTSIAYEMNKKENVCIEIFNIKGQKITTLVNEVKEPGKYSANWNGNDDNGTQVASGIYLYKMTTSDYNNTKKMIMLK